MWLTRDDVLILRADFEGGDFRAVEGRCRVLGPSLRVEDYRLRAAHTATSGNPVIVQLAAPEGFLQGAIVSQLGDFVETAPFTYPTGRIYSQLTIGKGLLPGGYEHTLVCAGYVTGHSSVGWPGGKTENAGDGLGHVARITLANPGAGVEWRYQPAEVYFEVMAGSFLYNAAAGGAARIIAVRASDGVTDSLVSFSPTAVAPGTAARINFGAGLPYNTNALPATPVYTVAWPVGLVLERAAAVQLFVAGGMPAGDTVTAISLSVRRWTI